MPKKKKGGKKVTGQTIDIFAFNGDDGQQNELPSGPANRPDDEGGGYGFSRGPQRHGGFEDRGPTASDGDDWRRAGSRVPTFGRQRNAGFAGRDNDGPSSQADTGPWRRSGGPPQKTMGNRFGGLQSSGDSRWGGGGAADVDTRPAHLRRFGKGGQDVRRTGTQDPRYSSGGNINSSTQKFIPSSVRVAAAPKKKVVQEVKRRAPRAADGLAAELRNVKLTNDAGLKSALENAVKDGETLDEKGLVSSFARLSLETLTASASGVVLAKSLIAKKITTSSLVVAYEAAQENKAADEARAVVLAACRSIKQKGKKAQFLLMEADSDAAAALTALLRGELTTEAFDAELKSQGIVFLNPVPDLSGEISTLLAGGADAASVLTVLDAKLPSERVAPKLKPLIVVAVLERVFENKSAIDLSIVDSWTSVLSRVAESDADNEADALFAAQQVWFRAGAAKENVLPTFKKLLESKVVSYDGLCAWRDDRVRGKNQKKSVCLIAVNSWINENQPTSCYCNRADDEEMVECQSKVECNGWVHWECEGLEGEAIDEAMESEYRCHRCNPQEEAA